LIYPDSSGRALDGAPAALVEVLQQPWINIMKLPNISFNTGFDGRIFLTKEEWDTYRRRKPVRYIRKDHTERCYVCNRPAEAGNTFQNAHLIGFEKGIICLGLTPDYVDLHQNIVTAHKKKCNQEAELTLLAVMKILRDEGITSLPDYLPPSVHDMWNAMDKKL
jgi:hypothetical protein